MNLKKTSFSGVFLIEIEKRHNKNYIEIFNKLKSLNFQAFCFVNNDLKLISDEEHLLESDPKHVS